MSRQSRLDEYAFKKQKMGQPNKKIKKDYERKKHDSSREGSEATERLEDSNSVVIVEQEEYHKLVCPAFLLLTPTAMKYYKTLEKSLRELSDHYNKDKVMDFILNNLRFCKIDNLKNLAQIKDDDFWGVTMPMVIEMTYRHIKQIEFNVRILVCGIQEVTLLSRMQVFLILACMFLGILPRQMHEDSVHFGQLMTIRDYELHAERYKVRREKLKCFMAYFKHIIENDSYLKGDIRLQRTKNTNTDFMDCTKMDREVPLRTVEILNIEDKAVEDYAGKGIMIDFANKKLGGGVLRNGCVQEEVLFSIFPQAVVSKLLCQELDDNQAVIIYGARRFSNYSGYSDTFKYEELKPLVSQEEASKSILVAIDATDFSKMPAENYQYSKKGVRRQINKAVTGFEGAAMDADEEMPIVTGRWGCGAFKGDQELKLLVQWVAASEANRQMIYITDEQSKVKEFRLMISQFQFMCTLDIIGILDEFYRVRLHNKNPPTLLNYLKNYVA